MSDRIRHSLTPGKAAQRRAEVQYAVSRVLSRASSVDEALDALLPALAEADTDVEGLSGPGRARVELAIVRQIVSVYGGTVSVR